VDKVCTICNEKKNHRWRSTDCEYVNGVCTYIQCSTATKEKAYYHERDGIDCGFVNSICTICRKTNNVIPEMEKKASVENYPNLNTNVTELPSPNKCRHKFVNGVCTVCKRVRMLVL